MTQLPIERQIAFNIKDVARMMSTYADQRGRQYGISQAQWSVLVRLERQEGLKQSELADMLDLQPISLTRLLDRLAENGLIERRPDPNDRRANRLYLKPAARPLLEQIGSLARRARVDVPALPGQRRPVEPGGAAPFGLTERELEVLRLVAAGRGNRDKSWGPRRWGGPKMWRWFSINIGDDTHFGGIRIGTDAGDLHRGWVWTDGAHSSVREWKVTSELAPDGVPHTATHVHATDKLGRVHALDAEILRVSPGAAGVKPNTTIVNEGLARWYYNGAVGYGINEAADYRMVDVTTGHGGVQFTLARRDGGAWQVSLPIPGLHNARNAAVLAACIAGLVAGAALIGIGLALGDGAGLPAWAALSMAGASFALSHFATAPTAA